MDLITQKLRKAYADTEEGLAKFIDGYLYQKYSALYVYYLKKFSNQFNGRDEVLIYPEDKSTPDFDALVKATTDQIIPGLMKRETNVYHGKVVKLDDAVKLVKIDRDINLPSLPETIIPYKKARDLILENPDHICVIDCPCRTTKENPCLPVDVCIIIGDPFVSFVLEHNLDNPRKLTVDEAIEIIKAEDDRGHVHTAFFKDAMADRFYCICNCCRCCCTAMGAHFINTPMMASSGYVCEISDDCVGCGNCNDYCQFDALSLEDGRSVIDEKKCMGCGVCESKCDVEAITLRRDPSKGEPLDVHELIPELAET